MNFFLGSTKLLKPCIATLFLILIACSKEKKTVHITYNDVSKLTNNSYIIIDNIKIKHSSNSKLIRYNKSLPAYRINLFNAKNKNAPFITTNHIQVLQSLKRILTKTNRYSFDSVMHLDAMKKLIFYRNDGALIHIEHSKEYPASIVNKSNR